MTPSGWHREDIKAAIRKRGRTLTELSKAHGYSTKAVSVALCKPWPAVESIIAAAIGVPPTALWPDRYLPDGTPRVQRRGWKDSSDRRRRNVKGLRAA